MLEIVPSYQFKIDLKLAQKRGYKIKHLHDVVNKLAAGQKLESKYCDHNLNGEYRGFWECHIEPDGLLVYRIEEDVLELFLFRTGTL